MILKVKFVLIFVSSTGIFLVVFLLLISNRNYIWNVGKLLIQITSGSKQVQTLVTAQVYLTDLRWYQKLIMVFPLLPMIMVPLHTWDLPPLPQHFSAVCLLFFVFNSCTYSVMWFAYHQLRGALESLVFMMVENVACIFLNNYLHGFV